MSYKIGSFNMMKWAPISKKSLEKIAEIIRKENFDIVAMQEVLSKEAVKELIKRHLPGWDYRWNTPNSFSYNASEGYAFIWNTKTVELVVTKTANGERVFEPRILNQYKLEKEEGQTKLIRNPYFGRFKFKQCFAEVRLINTHINFGKKENGDDSLGAVKQRNKEYDILAKSIYPKYAAKRYGNSYPAYTIILGDNNLNLKRTGLESYLQNEIMTIEDNGHERRIETRQSQKTTLKQSQKNKDSLNEMNSISSGDNEIVRDIVTKISETDPYANNYDHFSYDVLEFHDKGARTGISRVDAVRKYYEGKADEYRVEISDHVPKKCGLR